MTRETLKLAIASLLLTPALALATVPGALSFSARIADNGQPVNVPQNFTFKLWTVATGGTVGTDDIWTESQTGIPVHNGVVATTLGDVANGGTALPTFDGTPLWLEVTMGTTAFSPRIALLGVPYALHAAAADNASSVPWTGVTGKPAFLGTLACVDVANSVNLAAGQATFTGSGNCPAGYVLTGGGADMVGTAQNFWWWQSSQSGSQWLARGINSSAVTVTVTVFARCCRIQ